MKELIIKTIERLKKEKIKPLPRWRFVLVDVSYWAIIVLAIIFSAIAFSVGIYLLFQIDWDILKYSPKGAWGSFFIYIPYVWLIVLVMLMFAVFYFIRKTKEGYKYKWIVIMLSFFSLTMAIGVAAHFAQIGRMTDDFAYRKVPLYRNIAPGNERMWQRAEEGFLGGKVDYISEDKIGIRGPRGEMWEVLVSEKTFYKGNLKMKEGDFVKMTGKIKENGLFEAELIMVVDRKNMRGPIRGEREQEIIRYLEKIDNQKEGRTLPVPIR